MNPSELAAAVDLVDLVVANFGPLALDADGLGSIVFEPFSFSYNAVHREVNIDALTHGFPLCRESIALPTALTLREELLLVTLPTKYMPVFW